MRATELVQDPDDGDQWVLPGVGSFLRTGRVSRAAVAEAGGRRWQLARTGIVRTGFTATDEAGTVVGEQRDTAFRRRDELRWGDRTLRLASGPDGLVLLDGGRPLARMAPKRAQRRPLDVVVEDEAADPGLLLFMGFITQAYADDASFELQTATP